MFKAFFNTFILAVLLLVNLALITWFIDYLGQANRAAATTDTTTNAAALGALHSAPAPVHKRSNLAIAEATADPASAEITVPKGPTQQRIVLDFGKNSKLTAEQQEQLEALLDKSRLSPLHRVKVFAGPVGANNQALSPQMAKLRAHIIGRIVYSHTQSLSMSYQPTLKPGTVVVEISLSPY